MTEQTDVYTGFIDGEVRAERDRMAGLNARAASLLSTAGTLVAILAAVGTFVVDDQRRTMPRHGLLFLVLALALLTMAAVMGICAGWTSRYPAADTAAMRAMLRDHWSDAEGQARKSVADVNIRLIDSLRRANRRKANLLRAGWAGELAALPCLAAALFVLLSVT